MRRICLSFLILVLSHSLSYAAFPAKEVYETFSPSVVLVFASVGEGGGMIGTGSIITDSGHVITNAHVVVDADTGKPYPNIGISLKPAKVTGNMAKDLENSYPAEVMYYSKELDLALLLFQGWTTAADSTKGLNAISLANPEEIKVGEEVIAIGHPEQGGLWSLTYGRISGSILNFQDIQGKDVFQTDTSVNRGNSGGPLLDNRGYMVAVNSNIARVGSGGLPITGVNFSIKSSVVKNWLEGLGFKMAYGAGSLTGVEEKDEAETGKTQAVPEDKAASAAPSLDGAGSVKKAEVKSGEITEKNDGGDERYSTPSKPYDYETLLEKLTEELEGDMDEMREKARGVRTK